MRAILFALLVLAFVGADTAQAGISGRASVIDGDTLEIHGTRIRLYGIDAPESSQTCKRPSGDTWRCGQRAAIALAEFLRAGPIDCEERGRDRYRRVIAVCFKAGTNVNEWMVRTGWAVAYRKYSEDYVGAEETAYKRGVGIWSGEFVMPWAWRRGHRLNQTQ